MNKAETERTAYDYYMRGADVVASFFSSWKIEELYEARRLLEKSLSIDSNYARAYAKLAWTHLTAWINPLDGDHLRPGALDRAHELARKAVQLDPNTPQAYAELGYVLIRRREYDAAVGAFEKAIAVNPNFTDWRFAGELVSIGESRNALELAATHMRLDPFYAPLAAQWLGIAHCTLKQYSQALPLLRECVSRAPNYRSGRAFLAATYAQLGQLEEARVEAAEVLKLDPMYTIDGRRQTNLWKDPRDAEHYFEGLRKSRLPKR